MTQSSILLFVGGGLLVVLSLALAEARASDAMDLRDVAALTFRRGKTTAGRRAAGVPQLQCVGGDACSSAYLVDTIQCQNTGEDDFGEVQWKCETDLDDNLRLGELNVNCEGFSSRKDRLKLRGSCGLEYNLHYTAAGKNHRTSRQANDYGGGGYSSGGGSWGKRASPYIPSSYSHGDDSGSWASTLLLVGMIGLLIIVCMREQRTSSGSSGRTGGTGGSTSDGRPPPYNPNTGQQPSQPYGGWMGGAQPPGGFWGGAAMGGMLGSLFGRRGGYGGYGGYGGGLGNGWGGGGWGNGWGGGGYGNGYRRSGYTQTGYRSSSSGFSTGSSTSAGTTRRAAGFGGTTTR